MTNDEAALQVAAAALKHDRFVWLDAKAGGGWSAGRSVIGWLDDDDVSLTFSAADGVVTRHQSGRAQRVGHDIFRAIANEMSTGAPTDRWFGYFGYASRNDLPARIEPGNVPDAVWMRPSSIRSIAHENPPAQVPRPQRQHAEVMDERRYREAFREVQRSLAAGDSYEVNLTFRTWVAGDCDPFRAYLRLRDENPAPYAGFLQHRAKSADSWLLSSSPEQFVRINSTGLIETKPIKGTLPRSPESAVDDYLRRRLRTENRFRAESLMIVDLLRNDLATVCEPGSVNVPVLMDVESYAAVHQLVSTVQGRLRPDIGPVAAVRELFPPGSMTGAPKRRTMEIIREVEETARGPYAGTFGWLSAQEAELAVIIRSATSDDGANWTIGAGGGITVHSEAADELEEARLKASALLRAIAGRGLAQL